MATMREVELTKEAKRAKEDRQRKLRAKESTEKKGQQRRKKAKEGLENLKPSSGGKSAKRRGPTLEEAREMARQGGKRKKTKRKPEMLGKQASRKKSYLKKIGTFFGFGRDPHGG